MICHFLFSLGKKTFYDFLHLLENVQSLGFGSGMNVVPGNYSATHHQAASQEISLSCTESMEGFPVKFYWIFAHYSLKFSSKLCRVQNY